MNQRGTEQADAEKVENLRRVGARQLFLEDRLLDLGGAAAAPLRRPIHAEIARFVELALPLAAQLHQAVFGRPRIAQLVVPPAGKIGLEPCA